MPSPHSVASFELQIPQSSPTYDVIIVGGGVVGSVAACGFAQVGLRVALIEAQARSMASDRGQAYSINLLSAQVFQDLGLWDEIRPEIEAYRQVYLSDGDYSKVVHFQPQDLQTATFSTDTIGYVAEHRVLLNALQNRLKTDDRIDWICPATVLSTDRQAEGATVTIEQAGQTRSLQTQLIVAADGSNSPLRTQAQIRTWGWNYWQACIVAFIQPEFPHRQIAHERFQTDGPFAILPLPNGLCRIVWTAPKAETDRILKLDRSTFMQELQARYGDHMGQLTLVGEPSVFPVKLLHSTRYVQNRLALIGDAAHCCHPVGGQGINLGIRDAAALCVTLAQAIDRQVPFANLPTLSQYEKWRQRENLWILLLTDSLTRVFSNRILPIVMVRRISLWILEDLQPVKSLVLRLMQGLIGHQPRIRHSLEQSEIAPEKLYVPIRRPMASQSGRH